MRTILIYVFPYLSKAVIEFDQYGDSDNWKLYLVNGQEVHARISGNSFVHPFCMILIFITEEDKRHYTVIILPGSIDHASRRQLCKALAFPQ